MGWGGAARSQGPIRRAKGIDKAIDRLLVDEGGREEGAWGGEFLSAIHVTCRYGWEYAPEVMHINRHQSSCRHT